MRDLGRQRIAVYARYSSERQDAASIADQLRVCTDYAERRGGRVDDALVFTDAAISGASTARPGLHALQAAVSDGLVDVVLTEDLSRIGRSVGNNDRVLKQFRTWGARLIAINDGIDTGERHAKLLSSVKSAMAEGYLDELKERTKRGMDGRFDAGMWTGGKVYGYRTEPAGDGTDRKRLVVDEEQAAVVRHIFELYSTGHAQRAVAEQLNAAGIPSPRGKKWGHLTIREMVKNELYTGQVVFNRKAWHRDEDTGKRTYVERPRSEWRRREDPSLRIIDNDLWHAAQARGAQVAADFKQGARPKRKYPLSGLLQCALCGQPMVIAGGGRYYRCAGAQRGHACENRSSLREPAIRQWLLDHVRDTAGREELIREMRAELARTIGDHERDIKRELQARRAALTTTDNRLSKLIDLMLDGDDTHAMRAKRAELEDHAELQRAAIAKLERQLGQVVALPSAERLRAFLAALPEAVRLRPLETRDLLGAMLDGKVECHPPGTAHEHYRIAFRLAGNWPLKTNTRSSDRVFVSVGCGGRI